jgi:hypothetical protein
MIAIEPSFSGTRQRPRFDRLKLILTAAVIVSLTFLIVILLSR